MGKSKKLIPLSRNHLIITLCHQYIYRNDLNVTLCNL